MKLSFGKKTALFLLVATILVACVFFACACKEDQTVTVDFSLNGEPLPGSLVEVGVQFEGNAGKVNVYSSSLFSLEVTEGQEFVSVEKNKIRIAQTARSGSVFKLRLTVKDLSMERTFTVQATDVAWVRVRADVSAEAGDVLSLSAEVYPASSAQNVPEYVLVSGDATIENNFLTVSEDADKGEIVVKAIVEGVESDPVRIAITTVQTREIRFALSSDTALPGEAVTVIASKEPANSSFDLTFTIEKGADIARFDEASGQLYVLEDAAMLSEIVLVAKSGKCEEKRTLRVDRPAIKSVTAVGGGSVAPGAEVDFSYSVAPSGADDAKVRISVVGEGGEYLSEWSGTHFVVRTDAPQDAEIVFYFDGGKEAYDTLVYKVERRTLTSLTIDTAGSTSYLTSGTALTFTHQAVPADFDGIVNYYAVEGDDLVSIEGETVTVKEGVGMGRVVIVARSADGTESNPVEFTVSGRYSRRVYASWSNVLISTTETSPSIWMVLPAALNAGAMTVVVPRTVVDLVIEGSYDGTDATAYRDLYFYFRNAPDRTVTFYNFGTIATQGCGGTVMDFGSSGATEIVLVGKNLVRADSPYRLDNAGEETDGVWSVESRYASYDSLTLLRRSGKYGYRGAAGGTAISGHTLSFTGTGVLTAQAGDGVNGTDGGKGADARYGTEPGVYVPGAGGDGGHGGDSGVAIYAYSVRFASGLVTALPGNAGQRGKGGAAGDSSDLVGREDVVVLAGKAGADGKDGVCYPAVRATEIYGTSYTSSVGNVASRTLAYEGEFTLLVDKIARFYGVSLYYGTALQNPFASAKKRANRYTMTQQTNVVFLMQQAQFLLYTMSVMPKNCWKELELRRNRVTIYLCNKITSGSGGNILGLTSETNKVWFATFNTEVRGAYYGGYYNIMLHEFTHAFHYCFADAKNAFEKSVENLNCGLSYGTTSSQARVYGVDANYDESNSCFLSAYSRKNEMEDTAETLSMPATFRSLEPCMTEGCNVRKKFDLLAAAFGREYETLAQFKVGKTLFAYPHLFEAEQD